MKTITTSVLSLLLFGQAFGQVGTESDENSNIKYYVSSNGMMFHNTPDQKGGYLIPKDSLTNAIFAMMPMMVGLDVNGQMKGGIVSLNESDFLPGPTPGYYPDASYGESIWFMTKSDVDYHRAHWSDPGYTMPYNVAHWPGNGNLSIGQAVNLAPFFDVDQNTSYDPQNGDYPLISGDRAVYMIVSDNLGVHSSGLDPMGVEMHMMFYQYENNPDPVLNFTTFVTTTIFNRSSQTFTDFRFGHLVDFDLGNNMDDYIGTDVNRNLAYVYNGDLDDEDYGGLNGYGLNPPAVGVIALDSNMFSNLRLGSDYANGTEISNSLHGLQNGGDPYADNNGDPTTYVYTETGSNGWNEVTAGDIPGDRRSAIGYAPVTLIPGGSVSYHNAIIYARSNGDTLYSSVDSLFSVADHIQDFFDNYHPDHLEVSESKMLSLEIYPNPVQNKLSVLGINSGTFRILNIAGSEINSGTMNASGIDVEKLTDGFYILEITSNGKQGRKSFVKE